MKKSSFIAFMLSSIGIIVFGIGMCMSLLPEWNLTQEGRYIGVIGLCILLLTVFVYRRMEHKPMFQITPKALRIMFLSCVGILGLGIGMCLCMVYENMILGMIIGIVGILFLLSLIPAYKGIHN